MRTLEEHLAAILRHLAEDCSARVLTELDRRVEEAVARALDRASSDTIGSLPEILGWIDKDTPAKERQLATARARMKIRRDPGLAKLALVDGEHVITKGKHAGRRSQRLIFQKSAVLAYLTAKGARDER